MRKNFRSRIEARRESAKVRAEERKNITDVDQLVKLTERGDLHCKEAKRIFDKLQAQVQAKLAGMK